MQKLFTLISALALFAAPLAVRADEHANASLTTITYVVATQREAFSVAPSVYATYVGSCSNADAKTPIIDERKHAAVYVCNVTPKIVAEMQDLKFVPVSVGYRP